MPWGYSLTLPDTQILQVSRKTVDHCPLPKAGERVNRHHGCKVQVGVIQLSFLLLLCFNQSLERNTLKCSCRFFPLSVGVLVQRDSSSCLYVSLILHILRLRNAISPLCPHFRANRWGNSDRLYFLGSKITADGDCSHEIERCLLLGRKAMTSRDSMLKSRDVTLQTKVHLVKAMVFPAVMYGCQRWTTRKLSAKN